MAIILFNDKTVDTDASTRQLESKAECNIARYLVHSELASIKCRIMYIMLPIKFTFYTFFTYVYAFQMVYTHHLKSSDLKINIMLRNINYTFLSRKIQKIQ